MKEIMILDLRAVLIYFESNLIRYKYTQMTDTHTHA